MKWPFGERPAVAAPEKALPDAGNTGIISEMVADELLRDQQLAREFQQAFLGRAYPAIPAVHVQGRLRLEFAHSYQPALAIGGDFFDIMAVGQDCAGIFVADVMGHGTRSALITAILRTLLNELRPQGRNASHFLRLINQHFCALLEGLPFTFFASAHYFVADTTARVATFATAGHPMPFCVHRNLGQVTQLDAPKPRGTALGIMKDDQYSGGTVRLHDGDCFIFFTDGVYEAMNQAGDEFGMARLEQIILSNIYKTGPEILAAIRAAISAFIGTTPLHDDVCLVAVDITTTAARG